jgi:uncharacterized protein (UPF0332 family)
MISENMQALIHYRLEQADESIAAASILFQKNLLRRSVNSAYYAMFYAVMALLAIKMMETSKHGGAIGLFDREYVEIGPLMHFCVSHIRNVKMHQRYTLMSRSMDVFS